jgi:hypothetical protein
LAHLIARQKLVNKIVNKICIFVAISHTVATMKKADNPKNQSKVEANEQSGVPVPQALEAKSTIVELATPSPPRRSNTSPSWKR